MPRTHSLLLPIATVGLAVLATSTMAAKRVPCPDASYVVGARLLPGDGDSDLLTITGRSISLASGCPAKRGQVKGTKRGTTVRAKWGTCGALKRVVLQALIDPACRNATGSINWKKSGGKRQFTAVEASLVTTTSTTTTSSPASTTTTTPRPSTTTTPGSTTTSTTLFTGPCTPLTLDNVKAAVASGGVYEFCQGGSVTLDETLVVNGSVTLLGPSTPEGRGFVTYRREFGPTAFRLFRVLGSLTLDGAALVNGLDLGASGSSGAPADEAMAGDPGTPNNVPATTGGVGGTGEPGLAPGAGGQGGDGRGGAMLIEGGASVTLTNCLVENNGAVGGRGGDSGNAARAGTGGPGGDGGVGNGTNAGNGGAGGFPGTAHDAEDGGNGGNAEGGAIHNAGTLSVESCAFRNNFVTGGIGGRAGWGGSGGAGGSGGRGGPSNQTSPSGQPSNMGKGGNGGIALSGTNGTNGGRGGDGGTTAGGAIFSSGSLTLIDVSFRNNSATGAASGYGASGGAGGGGGGGGIGGIGNGCGKGGNGGDGGSGGNGGSNGNGGSARGGAVFSSGQPTLVGVAFVRNGDGSPSNLVGGGSGGLNNCTPGRIDCFGDGGSAGVGGTGAPGGSGACFLNGNPGGPQGAKGTDGADGEAGAVGGPGTPGAAIDPECSAGGASCAP